MNKIKTVKIKNEDGSISEESYTLSIDAKNVDMNNKKSVEETIGNIDVDKDGNIAEQLKHKLNNDYVIDSLNSTDATKALSARQGKILNDTLNSAQNDIKKKAYFFNTIADMKQANLKEGDYVCTLGYYEVNDGGAGEYQIITGNYEDNGGSYIYLNNNKIAQLIINNEINIKQFGVHGDGIYDDTEQLQKAIDYIENIVLVNNLFCKNEPMLILQGRYKITSTIYLSPFLKYYINGNVMFISYITQENTPTICINYNNKIISGSYSGSTYWIRGDIFMGGTIHILNSYDYTISNTIGLEIGDRIAGTTYQAISRGIAKNVSISGFKIGLLINPNHWYIYTFQNFMIHACQYDCKIGLDVMAANDSGENVKFENCLFGSSYYGLQINCAAMNLSFINCSFDFNTKGAIYINGSNNIHLIDCHIEGCKNIDSDLNGLIATPTNITATVYINIDRLISVVSGGMYPLCYGENLIVNIRSIREGVTSAATIDGNKSINNLYMMPNCLVPIHEGVTTINRLTSARHNLIAGLLEAETVGKSIATNETINVKLSYINQNTTENMKIATIDNNNVVEFSAKNNGLINGTFILNDFLPVDDINTAYYTGFSALIPSGAVYNNITFYFYDANKTQIDRTVWYGQSSSTMNGQSDWQKPIQMGRIGKCPIGTKYIKVAFTFIASSYVSTFSIKDLVIEKRL